MKKENLLELPTELIEKIKEEINRGPNKLTVKEKMVLALRLGMIGGKQHTLNEIGEIFGNTREYIRQTFNKAIKKI